MNFDYPDVLFDELAALGFANSLGALKETINSTFSPSHHGDFDKWQSALESLPNVIPSSVELNAAAVRVGTDSDLTPAQHEQFVTALKVFHPWRKGPFELFGHYIDTEWRSDWKWDRLINDISPLAGRRVLDIGCGSGYHCWRMRGAGARLVVGVDPTMLFVMQHFVLQSYIRDQNVHVLPLGMDQITEQELGFDTVFSMGLLYHRRDPIQHLNDLRACLREHGELVLETLVIDSRNDDVLVPDGRYAQMRNVWSIPSVSLLESWLGKSGFKNIRCIDVTKTTTDEQRSTPWMQFQSLADYLDKNDPDKTVEGYPAPVRCIMLAQK